MSKVAVAIAGKELKERVKVHKIILYKLKLYFFFVVCIILKAGISQ